MALAVANVITVSIHLSFKELIMSTLSLTALWLSLVGVSALVGGCTAVDEEAISDSDQDLSTAPDATSPAPTDRTRRLTCPVLNTNESATAMFRGKPYTYKSDAEVNFRSADWESRATIDPNALDGLVPSTDRAVVIDIRRVNGKPSYAYYGAMNKLHDVYEPWSSAKFMAASAAMGRARAMSQSKVGGSSKVNAGAVGNLITAMESYSTTAGIPGDSNAIAGYFLTVAGATPTNQLFAGKWLNLSNDSSKFQLSSNPNRENSAWGAPPFAAGSKWTMPNGESVTIARDTQMVADKSMSALAQGEWLKRLSQHEIAPESSMPGIQKADVDVLFYGAAGTVNPGGMLSGVSNYMANAIIGSNDLEGAASVRAIDAKNGGKSNWRIFDKVGWGDSSSRSRSEVVLVSYACVPEFDGGHEFVVVLRTSIPASSVDAAGAVAQKTMNKLVSAVLAAK
jgi:hypothetical protein